ncbi:hypothetical protein V6N12_037324 [Hibiscus sabdariffa]|uniref:Uncharacterized protein n=1 Tax=Hibiscus sabdariffa TaxID=183260 RepID=A0ABR2C3J0_9ROSI
MPDNQEPRDINYRHHHSRVSETESDSEDVCKVKEHCGIEESKGYQKDIMSKFMVLDGKPYEDGNPLIE